MPNVEANGISIEYDIRGEGEPILFVMGLGAQLIDWREEFVDLFVEQGYQVIRFDNRDSGLSGQDSWSPPSPARTLQATATRRPLRNVGYTLEDMADDAVGLLDALDLDAAHVVGASMGGMIVQEMAIGYPERVLSMCSIMSNTGDRRHGMTNPRTGLRVIGRRNTSRRTAVDDTVEMYEAISGPHFDEEAFREHAEHRVARSFTPAGFARQFAAIAGSRDRTQLLGDVTAPTLVVHGLVDPLVRPSGGFETAKRVQGSRLLAFGDMGHDLPRPRWPEISQAMIDNFERAAATTETSTRVG